MKPLWIFRSSFYEIQDFLGNTPICSKSIKLLLHQNEGKADREFSRTTGLQKSFTWPWDGGGQWSHSVITAGCFCSRKCWENETVHIWFSERRPSQPDLRVPRNWGKSPTLPPRSRSQMRYNWNSPKEGILLKWREKEEMFWLFQIQHLFQTMHILFIQQIFPFNENTK